jgi:hypothetical protein
MRFVFLALSAPVVLLACAAGGGSGGGSPSPEQSPSTQLPSSQSPGALDPGPVPVELFDQIVADAAAKAGVDPSTLTVVSAAAVTWSDGSIGCPAPGMSYTQALVPGYRVLLEANGQQYDYHVGQRGQFILCPPNRSKDPVDDGT